MIDPAVGAVIILSGPPGAGKSTTAATLAQRFSRAVHLTTDDFWHFIVVGAIPPYLPESDDQNHAVVEAVVGAAFSYAEGGFSVMVDGIVGPWMLDHYRRAARIRAAIPVHYVVLRPDRAHTLRRAQGRVSPALVAPTPVLSLWDQFADLGALEHHVIDTSNHNPKDTVEVVAEAVSYNSHRLWPRLPADGAEQ